MGGELWQDKPSIRCFCGSPVDPWQQEKTRNNGLSQDDVWLAGADLAFFQGGGGG